MLRRKNEYLNAGTKIPLPDNKSLSAEHPDGRYVREWDVPIIYYNVQWDKKIKKKNALKRLGGAK